MPDPVSVSFVIPVRNDAAGLARCLSSIRGQRDQTGVEIVVVDNGSVDGSGDVARSFGATVLRIPDHGVSTLRNRGVEAARGDLIAFVDADMQLGPDWLETARQCLAEPAVVAVGAEYSPAPDANWVQLLYDGLRQPTRDVIDTRWLPTGNILIRRAAFEAVGGFDESLQSCEDWDLCVRLRAGGHRLLSVEALRSPHFGDPASMGSLFRGEAWRGRDNLRVSIRHVPALRDLPGILVPILWLAGVVMVIAGVVLSPIFGMSALMAAALGLAMAMGLSLVRAFGIWRRTRYLPVGSLSRAWLVAVVFDAARALALVHAMPHRRATIGRPSTSGADQ